MHQSSPSIGVIHGPVNLPWKKTVAYYLKHRRSLCPPSLVRISPQEEIPNLKLSFLVGCNNTQAIILKSDVQHVPRFSFWAWDLGPLTKSPFGYVVLLWKRVPLSALSRGEYKRERTEQLFTRHGVPGRIYIPPNKMLAEVNYWVSITRGFLSDWELYLFLRGPSQLLV